MSYYSHEGVISHFQIVVLKAHDLVKAITQLYILSTNQKYKDFRTYRFMQSNENIIVSINKDRLNFTLMTGFFNILNVSLLISINSNALEIHVAMNL